MNVDLIDLVVVAVSFGLFAYLLFALIKAERF